MFGQGMNHSDGPWDISGIYHPHGGINGIFSWDLPSGKRLHNYGTSPFLIGKSTISTGPFSIANC